MLHVTNGSGGSLTVTIVTPGTSDGLAVADRTVTIPNGEERVIGPFLRAIYNATATGKVTVQFSATTSVTCQALVGDAVNGPAASDDGRYHCPTATTTRSLCGQMAATCARNTARHGPSPDILISERRRSRTGGSRRHTPGRKRRRDLRRDIMAAQRRLSSIKINTGSVDDHRRRNGCGFPEFMNYVAESTGHDSSGGYYEAVATGKKTRPAFPLPP